MPANNLDLAWMLVYDQLYVEKPSLFTVFQSAFDEALHDQAPMAALFKQHRAYSHKYSRDLAAATERTPASKIAAAVLARAARYVAGLRELAVEGLRWENGDDSDDDAGPVCEEELEGDEDWQEDLARCRMYQVPVNATRIGEWHAEGGYKGQQLAGLNLCDQPNCLEITFNRWKPELSKAQRQIFEAGQGGQDGGHEAGCILARDLLPSLQVARRLRLSYPLSAITRMHYARGPRDKRVEPAAAITLEVNQAPAISTGRVACAASDMNKFRARSDFTRDQQALTVGRVKLVGAADDLEVLAAMILKAAPQVQLAAAGEKLTQPAPVLDPAAAHRIVPEDERDHPLDAGRRQAILQVLLDMRLISEEELNMSPEDIRKGTRCQVNNFLGHLKFDRCFLDYLNFRCDDSDELRAKLSQPVNLTDCYDWKYSDAEHNDEEEGMEEEAEEEAEPRGKTVADVMRRGCPAEWRYSFCQGEMQHEDHDSHCPRCHQCRDWHHWHCRECDRCTYGQTISLCEHCGSHCLRQNSKPLPVPSVLQSQVVEALRDSMSAEWLREVLPSASDSDDEANFPEVPPFDIGTVKMPDDTPTDRRMMAAVMMMNTMKAAGCDDRQIDFTALMNMMGAGEVGGNEDDD